MAASSSTADWNEPRLIARSVMSAKKRSTKLIECRGRREVHLPARPLGEPVADQRGFVSAVIINGDLDVEVGGTLRSTSSRSLRNS
jgi:hypothetical protein